MIDSLVGVGMLVMLTGWMAGLVSVQYSLSSSRRALSQAEQVEYLRSSVDGGALCDRQLLTVVKDKDKYYLPALQKLMVAPELAQRDEGVSLPTALRELRANADFPYDSEDQLKLLLHQGSASGDPGSLFFDGTDWKIILVNDDNKQFEQSLFLC